MWNSSMEPSGHMGLTYFFVPLYSNWGCNNNSSSNHGQWLFIKIKRHPHSLSRAKPGDWFPGDTASAGNECTGITNAKLLRKPEAPWCVIHTFVKAALLRVCWHHQISGDKMVPCVGKVLLWFPLWWAALMVVTCKLQHANCMVTCKSETWFHCYPCLEPWVSEAISLGLFKYA